MKVLVTGNYKQSYNRIRIMLSGLKKHGIDLIEYNYEKRDSRTSKRLSELSLECDVVFLPSFTHPDVPFVKKNVSKPVVFDPLVSRYLTKVFDRRTVWKYSPRAYKNFLKDKRAFRYSDLIIADTESHKEYYCINFKLDPEKVVVIPVGVDTDMFFPIEKDAGSEKVIVGFYGTFIPLHGIEKILLAANELKDEKNILFEIYGTGPLFNKIFRKAVTTGTPNVEFKGWVEYDNLNSIINNTDICLGIFGESLKTELVIPNKIYHYAACSKPIITRDTKGIREIFTHGKNIILSSNDPSELASSIHRLASDPDLRNSIGSNAYSLVSGTYNEMIIADKLIKAFEKVI